MSDLEQRAIEIVVRDMERDTRREVAPAWVHPCGLAIIRGPKRDWFTLTHVGTGRSLSLLTFTREEAEQVIALCADLDWNKLTTGGAAAPTENSATEGGKYRDRLYGAIRQVLEQPEKVVVG